MKSYHSVNLFIGVIIGTGLFFLAAFPVFAGTSDNTHSSTFSENTPTVTPSIIQSVEIIPSTPTPAGSLEPVTVITKTQSTATFTSSLTITLTETLTPYPTQFAYLPNLYREYANPNHTPPQTVLFCDNLSDSLPIPDDNTDGINDDIFISDGRVLVSASLYVDISHSWVGDLVVRLTNQNTGDSITALDRPGTSSLGCGNNDIVAILDDAAAQPADDKCASYPHAISGIYLPNQPLGIFSGKNVSGTWRLNVSDRYPNDIGSLNHWCLAAKLADAMPEPTPTPTPGSLPSSASISGMWGQDQALNLDCESRSAVDWARYYGFNIDEIDFLNNLPRSDDPEAGFVGDPDGLFGNIPPNDYGVHAPPVAALLRDYGLTANSFRSLRWDDLRAEIASGNPAIVWIIGGSNYSLVNGTPHFYTAVSTGNTTIVAPWEHTVILVGYTSTDVTVLNGSRLVTVPLDQFLDSWSALNFMAVLGRP